MRFNTVPVMAELNVAGFSPNTTPVIVYDKDALPRDSSSTKDLLCVGTRPGVLLLDTPLAASLMAFTANNIICLPDLWLSGPTLPTLDRPDYSPAFKPGRHITLREARLIAMRAHREFEEGLYSDRVQESRRIELADENDT